MVEKLLSPQKIQIISVLYLLTITIGSWIVVSWSFALAVLAGGAISIVSFAFSKKDAIGFLESMAPVAKQLVEGEKKQIRKVSFGLVIKFWLRFIVIGVVLFLLIRSHKVNVLGLILGLSTVVCTVVITVMNAARYYIFSGRR